jgi:hypothetical protein
MELLLDQREPGAQSAIVVGRVETALGLQGRYRDVLWFVDEAGAGAGVGIPGLVAERIHPAVLGRISTEALVPMLERFLLADAKRLPDLIVTDDVAGPSVDGYVLVVDAIHREYETSRRVRVTRQREGYLWQRNLLVNLVHFLQRRVPSSWQGALAGVPAFVCGAGPSLDVSAPVLAKIADRGVVLAADSALRLLSRHDVRADFAVSVDATKPPEKCLPTETAPARVVLAGISPPSWCDHALEFETYFASGYSLTEHMLVTHGVEPTALQVRENCGITALELALFLGCAPIFLFGMDLAADAADPRRRHNADSDPTIDRGEGFHLQTSLPAVPGNYSESVPTFLFGELQGVNERLAALAPGLVVNVNDRGARLENCALVHPREFVPPPEAGVRKRRVLSALAGPFSVAPEAMRGALGAIGAQGAYGCREVETLRDVLREHGVDALVARLRSLFVQEQFARTMGAFSLKLMPHLTPPVEGDEQWWSAMLDEMQDLSCLAEAVYGASVV